MNNCQAGHTSHDRIEVKTDVGPMIVYDWKKYSGFSGFCTGQDDVSMTLDLYGCWDKPIKNLIERITYGAASKGTFIDVGSHIGYFSRLASNYSLKVLAYEAEDENLDIFNRNVPSAQAQQIWFDDGTLPEAFDPTTQVDIMKIDIEGSERHAVRYFEQLIENKQVKNIIMEVSPTFNDSYPALLLDLKKQGYFVRELDGQPFDWNFDFNQTNLWLHL